MAPNGGCSVAQVDVARIFGKAVWQSCLATVICNRCSLHLALSSHLAVWPSLLHLALVVHLDGSSFICELTNHGSKNVDHYRSTKSLIPALPALSAAHEICTDDILAAGRR